MTIRLQVKNMTAQHIETMQNASGISKYKSVIALVSLPVALALIVNNYDIQSIPTTLTSGVFTVGFTLLSWGMAAKLAYKLRK